jgi:hypothetical protein
MINKTTTRRYYKISLFLFVLMGDTGPNVQKILHNTAITAHGSFLNDIALVHYNVAINGFLINTKYRYRNAELPN